MLDGLTFRKKHTFSIQHKARIHSKIVDSLSYRHSLLFCMRLDVLDVDSIKELLPNDSLFAKILT